MVVARTKPAKFGTNNHVLSSDHRLKLVSAKQSVAAANSEATVHSQTLESRGLNATWTCVLRLDFAVFCCSVFVQALRGPMTCSWRESGHCFV